MAGWMKIKRAAAYADCSERLFRDWLKAGLRHIRYGGTIRTRPEWIDEFLQAHEISENGVDRLVEDVCRGLGI